jgi:putative oxidoreductase
VTEPTGENAQPTGPASLVSGDPLPKPKRADCSGHRWLGLLVRLYLGSLFIIACLHKIQHPETFAIDVATYQLLPEVSVNLFSLAVPWIELAVGVMLVIGWRVRAAALVVSCLMVGFMLALGWALAKGLDMSCGCFASQSAKEQDPISWRTLLRDSAWLLLGLYITWFDRRPLGLDQLDSLRHPANGT